MVNHYVLLNFYDAAYKNVCQSLNDYTDVAVKSNGTFEIIFLCKFIYIFHSLEASSYVF